MVRINNKKNTKASHLKTLELFPHHITTMSLSNAICSHHRIVIDTAKLLISAYCTMNLPHCDMSMWNLSRRIILNNDNWKLQSQSKTTESSPICDHYNILQAKLILRHLEIFAVFEYYHIDIQLGQAHKERYYYIHLSTICSNNTVNTRKEEKSREYNNSSFHLCGDPH